ncbi:hypothetical protein QFW96_25315 [Saccharopolyspora sp. TS4A08]|uniref:Uncharacterized protein n=1 Tax=Saccharopolyspora ipomoeae TaxID=3042027 RepID=A0ABT6PVD0_9PSEU|nr:hypothetical protein [Saccharopolyspora sp. TS4A08]MDI2031967.1 hypothetical protein [Saccharopolyspora sp. TS4A08]
MLRPSGANTGLSSTTSHRQIVSLRSCWPPRSPARAIQMWLRRCSSGTSETRPRLNENRVPSGDHAGWVSSSDGSGLPSRLVTSPESTSTTTMRLRPRSSAGVSAPGDLRATASDSPSGDHATSDSQSSACRSAMGSRLGLEPSASTSQIRWTRCPPTSSNRLIAIRLPSGE